MAGGTVNFTYQIGKKSIGGFEIDAFLVEQYNFSNKMTNLPVEEGATISDHVVEDPDTLFVEAFIGKTKFETYTGEMPEDISTIEIPDPKARIRQAYHELLRMKREKQPLDVVTGLDTFPNMLITSFNISRDVETGADLPFSMTFQNIKTIKSEETTIALSESSAQDQARATSNVGTVGKEETKGASWESRWYEDYITGLLTRNDFFDEWNEYPEQYFARTGDKGK
jgi:hypothetical protein